jgi:hypothetical protein
MGKSKRKYPTGYKQHMSIREASDFWDKHSIFEFDGVKEVKIDFDLKGEKHVVLIDPEIARRIGELARTKRLPRHKLVNDLLKKSLSEHT